ncbi:MAG: ACP S-malonyltransferase [Nanoarchaeota archaeon]|nr:ACP S-malonyltransferase [Nanoarchaeota archaeon]MBU4284599.1 ACP S-malonyltransferase [Nanoarchaeota archaeon]
MKVCYVFPGQGSQSVGMGKNIYNKYESARKIFHNGNEILKFDITDLMFKGPEEDLGKTINCQPAILLANLAYFSVLNKKIPCSLTLGHSIGEYSALVASKAISLEDAVKLVKTRAKLMSECIPDEIVKPGTSHMAAVLTDNHGLVYNTCKIYSSPKNIVHVANVNSQSQIVISGNNNAVIRAAEHLTSKGIKVIYLKVEGPFHSVLMKPAAEGMEKALENIVIKKPTIPYIANFTADFVYEQDQIKKSLVNQIYRTVKWKQSLEKAIQSGFETFIECGPGGIQTKLLKRNPLYKDITILNVKDYINQISF